jgi:predicted metalloendopeptidase
MNKTFPYLDWLQFLEVQMGGQNLQGSMELFIKQPKFFESFGKLMDRTPIRDIANFLFWRIADRYKSFMANRLYEPGLHFFEEVFHISRIEEGWKRCVLFTKKYFSTALGALDARSNRKRVNQDVEAFMKLVKDETLKYVSQLNITESESKEFQRRLENTEIFYKPPEQFFDDSTLESYYQNLTIYSNQYFKNILRLQKFSSKVTGARLFRPTSQTLWQFFLEDSYEETYYSSDLRFIYFSSSEFQSPHYHPDLPTYLNFAGIGSTVIKYLTFALNNEVSCSTNLP